MGGGQKEDQIMEMYYSSDNVSRGNANQNHMKLKHNETKNVDNSSWKQNLKSKQSSKLDNLKQM